MAFERGTRAKVIRDSEHGPGPWPDQPTGVVGAAGLDSEYQIVETSDGPTRSYWVTFDDPQWVAEGDGPYVTAQVLERYLVPT